jgi:predicted hotdog family 3-hydroxylacyl-ACP dehydratase
MAACPWSPGELLPHADPMVLLDSVLDWNAVSVTVALTVRIDDRFFEPNLGVPVHLGIEWMAQACGVYSGLKARTEGRPVSLGFLLGTRRFLATRSWLQDGERLRVAARLVYEDDGIGVFDCRILSAGDADLAVARLTTYQPEDPALVLANKAKG